MLFTPASTASLAAFVLILVCVAAAFLFALRHALGKQAWLPAAIFLLVLLLDCAAAGSGALAEHTFPLLPIFFFGNLAIGLFAGLSPLGKRLALATPLAALLGFQAFRLPLELVLHAWANEGVIPETMTWSGAGQNFDVIAGAAALLIALFARRSRTALWAGNLIGFALLLNVIRVVLRSSPGPIGWHLANPLQLPFHLPYALIIPLAVALALTGQVVLTRALLQRRA